MRTKNRKEMKETWKGEARREHEGSKEGRKSRGRDEGEVLSEEGREAKGSRMDGPAGQKKRAG